MKSEIDDHIREEAWDDGFRAGAGIGCGMGLVVAGIWVLVMAVIT